MPEHLRVGVAAESLLLRGVAAGPGRARAYDRGSARTRASSAGRRAASTPSASTCDCSSRSSCSPRTSSRRQRRDEEPRRRSTPTSSSSGPARAVPSPPPRSPRAGRDRHGGRRRPVGRPGRDGAVLARGDGREVPPRRARPPRSARPTIAYAEGRCVGGSTEINSGLYHRLPADLAERVAPRRTQIEEFAPEQLDGYAERIENAARGVAAPGRAAAVVGGARAGRDQARLAVRRVRTRVPLRARRAGA